MLLLVRFAGEVFTKSRKVRRRFQQRLVQNMQDALGSHDISHTVHLEWDRIRVEADDPQAAHVLKQLFGVSSVSPVDAVTEPDLQEIVAAGEAAFADQVRGKKFGVRAKRTGEHPFRSHDICVELGAALNQYAKVDLRHPDVMVSVEVRPDHAYLYGSQEAGPGGLPLGVQGKAVALLSGGFDSAVAAWLMLRRGIELDYVFCNLAGAAYERTVLSVAKILAERWSFGTRPTLHVVDYEPVVKALREKVKPHYVQVVLKRLMYRTALQIARFSKAAALVTGESVGQVSSQTLLNLRVIDEVATLPVLRPLIGMNKNEIIERSHHVGTYALSAAVQEYCALVPQKPSTAAQLKRIREEEARLDMGMLDRLAEERKVIDVRALDSGDLVMPYLYTSEVPAGAQVIDCREPYQYEAWHFPDALSRPLDELLEDYGRLDRGQTYVLYCPYGLQSAVAAEKMQRSGYEAYSFKGGSTALRQYAEEAGYE